MRLTGKKCGKILCDHCDQPLIFRQKEATGEIGCRFCGAQYQGAFFNVAARFRQQSATVVTAQQLQDAQCFFHPGKEAHAVCTSCGRMLCALCDIEQGAEHTCPRCMNDQRKDGVNGEQRSSLAYTQIAWGLILLSFVIPLLPALVGAGFAVAGMRNSDYCNSTGRKISLALVVIMVSLVLCILPVLVFGGMAL